MSNLELRSRMRKHGCTLLTVLIVGFHFSRLKIASAQDIKDFQAPFKLEDLNKLVELVIAKSKLTWKDADIFDEKAPPGVKDFESTRVSEFWGNHRVNMSDAIKMIDAFNREIWQHQTDKLMNKLIKAEDMKELEQMMNQVIDSPAQMYRLKWLEVSSLASTLQHVYQRRKREIMPPDRLNETAKYLETTATSIKKIKSTVFWTKTSDNPLGILGKPLIKTYPSMIDTIFTSVEKGHLFKGLRSMMDETPGAMDFDLQESCKDGGLGRVKSVGAPHPKYVLFYLALTDVKYFLIQLWLRLFNRCYELVEHPEYKAYRDATDLDDHLREVVKQKISWYNEAFGDFVAGGQGQGETDSGVFRCDPVRKGRSIGHVEKATYIKVTNFMRGFIESENKLRPSGSCLGTCTAFNGTLKSCDGSDIDCLTEQDPKCAETPELCRNFSPACPIEDIICSNSFDTVHVCESIRRDRLLDWVVADGDNYGSVAYKNCESNPRTMNSQHESSGEVHSPMCELCMCQCHSPVGINATSVRLFSIQPSISDVSQNKIVVGIKFEQIGDQIHVLTADAKALPEGKVDMASLKWKRPRGRSLTVKLSKQLKTVHLDDLNVPEGSVVTGVRWTVGESSHSEYSQYLGLEIMVTNIDISTGRLDISTNRWIGQTDASRIPYTYTDPDDPMKADGPSEPDSKSGQYIHFRGTSLTKDLAQTTIPFIDAQKVILDADQSAWLKGIGLIHKSRRGYGGYLSLKIKPYETQY